MLAADVADDGFDFNPVGRRGGCARSVAEQLFGQGAGQLVLVGEQQLLVLVDVLKPSAVRQHVGGVDLRAVPISLLSAVDDPRLPCADAPIMVSPAADDVEVLQGKSGGVDL